MNVTLDNYSLFKGNSIYELLNKIMADVLDGIKSMHN